MPDKDIDQLGELQSAVLEALWDLEEATVKDVLEVLTNRAGADRTSPPAYTTVLTVLQKLTRSGWVTHRSAGRTYVYRPVCTRAEAGCSAMRRFVDTVFDGDRMLAFQQMISGAPLDADELATLRKLVDATARERKERRDG